MKGIFYAISIAGLLMLLSCKKDNETKALLPVYKVVDNSVINWKGFLRNGYFNEGSIEVKGKNIDFSGGLIKSGEIEMPLSSITNYNITDETLRAQLIHHLQSADFFNIALYPSLKFEIVHSEFYDGSFPGAIPGANVLVTGKLTILGTPGVVVFPAKVSLENNELIIKAKLKINRLNFGLNYNSDESLSDSEYIMPDIFLDFDLRAIRI